MPVNDSLCQVVQHNDNNINDKNPCLKICLLSYRSNPYCGGQGVYINNLSRALRKLGHIVDIVAGPPYPILDKGITLHKVPSLDLYNPDDLFRTPSLKELFNIINFIEWASVSTMGFPEPLTFGFRAYQFLKDKFKDYDIIHDNQSLSYGLFMMKKKIPTIATIHHPISIDRDIAISCANSFFKKLQHRRWYSFIGMQKKVARVLPKIITVSQCSKNDIHKDFNINLKKFKVVPNGIDTKSFYPVPEIKREKNRIIVTNSADMPLKGIAYLLKAIKLVVATHKVKLIIIGTPNPNGDVAQLVKGLKIKDFVTFTGRIDNGEFVKQYAKASIAVVPSVYEGFGLPVGEAMACGVPVICTTGGALPEVAGDAAYLVPAQDPEALARAIVKLIDDKNFAKELGDKGYQRVQKYFTWEKTAHKTIKVYREVINGYNRF